MNRDEEIHKKAAKLLQKVKKLEHFSDDASKYHDLVKLHLQPCGDDLILLTLKGHLVIENLLEMNVLRLLAIDRLSTRSGKLGFNQKLQLVLAVVEQREPGPNADLFCAIDHLNQLRNQLAHNLKDQVQIESLVKEFVRNFHKLASTKLISQKSLATQLKSCILQLCMFVYKVRCHFYKLETQEDE
jgi:hypothetical protein